MTKHMIINKQIKEGYGQSSQNITAVKAKKRNKF